jgi:hypothetical protein
MNSTQQQPQFLHQHKFYLPAYVMSVFEKLKDPTFTSTLFDLIISADGKV